MSYNVVFHPGSYGTYLAWSLYTYSELNTSHDINLPFGEYGSAHLFRQQDGFKNFLTMHLIPPDTKNIVFIKPLKSLLLEYFDNQLMKHYKFEGFLDNILYEHRQLNPNWGDNSIWELRELLSFFMPDMFLNSFNDHNHGDTLDKVTSIQIYSDEIINTPKKTIVDILNFFSLKTISTIDQLDTIHNTYLGLQKNFNKDIMAEEYVTAAINNQPYKIDNMTLIDESWIQHLLRQQGYEIKCWNLNEFPVCASKLTELLEKC